MRPLLDESTAIGLQTVGLYIQCRPVSLHRRQQQIQPLTLRCPEKDHERRLSSLQWSTAPLGSHQRSPHDHPHNLRHHPRHRPLFGPPNIFSQRLLRPNAKGGLVPSRLLYLHARRPPLHPKSHLFQLRRETLPRLNRPTLPRTHQTRATTRNPQLPLHSQQKPSPRRRPLQPELGRRLPAQRPRRHHCYQPHHRKPR